MQMQQAMPGSRRAAASQNCVASTSGLRLPVKRQRVRLAAGSDLINTAQDAVFYVDVIADAVPAFLQPVVQAARVIESDFQDIGSLSPTLPGVVRLIALYYAFLSNPNPVWNILDFYVFGPIATALSPKLSADDYILRDKLGGGNFGVAWEGVKLQTKEGESVSARGQLTPEQKKRR